MSNDQEKKMPTRIKGDCPACGKDRWAYVHGEKCVAWDDDETPLWSRDTHRLLECAGCEKIFYQHVSVFSEHYEHKGPYGEQVHIPSTVYFPPQSKRKRPDWLARMPISFDGEGVTELFETLYKAIDHNLIVLAASGIRTVFDIATTELGIDSALPFEAKVEALKAQGRIGQYEQEDIKTMIDAANAAMHRGWKPTLEQLDTMMTTLERFLHHSFMLEGKAKKLKDVVPPRQQRKKQID